MKISKHEDSDGTGYCRGCGTTIGEEHHPYCDLMKWQPISSAPDEEYDILVAWSDRTIGILDGHSARSNMKTMVSGDYLTHWMLLPEPPK